MTYAAGEIVWCLTGCPLFNVPAVCEVELLCRMIGPHDVPSSSKERPEAPA